jgi:hypothetical protein
MGCSEKGLKMAAVQLQFVCEAAFSSEVIAWFSQGHFSHVDAILPNGKLLGARNDSVGGQPPGVRMRPPRYTKFSRRVVMTVPSSEAQALKFYEFLGEQVGKPYDTQAIWAFAFNRNWRETDSWICSELVSAAGEASGIFPALYLAANKITPVSCALAFSAVGGSEKGLV